MLHNVAEARKVQTDSEAVDPEVLKGWLTAVAVDRDRQAFQGLFRHFAPRVKAYMYRSDRNHELAEELAQETMLQIWRKAHLFDSEKAGASTWIFAIARNLRIDRLRRDRRPEIDTEDPMLVPDAPEDGEQSALRSEEARRVREALKSLPPEQAEVVMLNFFEGLPHTAIAERLSVPLGTVKSRLRLAFGRVRTALGDEI